MKVLHVLPFPGIGGTEIATRRIAEAVRPFGILSTALLLRPTMGLRAYLEEGVITCLDSVERPEPSLLREASSFLRTSNALAKIFRDFDIIHCADVSAAYRVAVAGRLAGRPVLCHVRNRETRIDRRERIFINAANHFAFVSRNTLDHFPMRIRSSRSSILYDGIDIPPQTTRTERAAAARAVRGEFGLPDNTVIVAMFARVHPQKDYFTLIRAAARLREAQPALHFLIVGDNSEFDTNRQHFIEVQDFAHRAGVLDRFVFAGFRTDLVRLMYAADLCVLCTHFEGLPLVLLETMAAGRPCIATAVDGVPEALTDGVTGLLHRAGDAEGLAAAITRLIADPEQADALGAAARIEAERRFGRDRFASDVQSLYEKLRATQSKGSARERTTRAAAG